MVTDVNLLTHDMLLFDSPDRKPFHDLILDKGRGGKIRKISVRIVCQLFLALQTKH